MKPARNSWLRSAAERLGLVYLASVVALTLMVPLDIDFSVRSARDDVAAAAFVPAIIAWLAICVRPRRDGPAILRGAALAFALVGAAGLCGYVPPPISTSLAHAMLESRSLTVQAEVYLGLGLIGVIASLFVKERASERGAQMPS